MRNLIFRKNNYILLALSRSDSRGGKDNNPNLITGGGGAHFGDRNQLAELGGNRNQKQKQDKEKDKDKGKFKFTFKDKGGQRAWGN